MRAILFFDAISDLELKQVGGKGLSLSKMANAGLPVPPGFVITTDAFRSLAQTGICADASFTRELEDAYTTLGGLVAVRSSAPAEDGAEASFAGQQETVLGVRSLSEVIAAIERCWSSLFTERAIAYRKKQGLDEMELAMAVVVQSLVPAEVAGVLFTRDPFDAEGSRMLVEASWGLGEAVVSGRVTPDRFRLDRIRGTILDQQLGRKSLQITADGEESVPAGQQACFCLDDKELSHLAELGRSVEQFYGDPRDIEWAFADRKFFLLQARPITAIGAAEREEVRREIIARMIPLAEPGGTVWVRYNLSEVLPTPTPMTWAVVQHLLTADGGFGAMNRDLGAKPDPALGSQSAFDLVAGRPMANLSRMPRLQFRNPPIEYPFAVLKADPRAAMNPVPVLSPLRAGIVRGLLRLPATIWRLMRLMSRTKLLAASFAERFTAEIVPSFIASVNEARFADWEKLETPVVMSKCEEWVKRTLVEFARESLKPTVFADLAWNTLIEMLKPPFGAEHARTVVSELARGARPSADADLAGGIHKLATGEWDQAAFLERFGHRSANEMELSQPRWSEAPAELERLVAGAQAHHPSITAVDPATIAAEAKISGSQREVFLTEVKRLRTYLGLREAAKNDLLKGYAVIRKALCILDRRFGLNGGLFFLTPADFPDLLAGKDLTARIVTARRRRQTELTLEVPPVLLSDDLSAIGRPRPEPHAAEKLEGVALSAGVAEGIALVLTEPIAAPADEGYILVCPTTDPAWIPLFVNARGLIMETGGVLSHGAIVAREFGLPAVAGLPGVVSQLRTGQRLHIDGGKGTVHVISE